MERLERVVDGWWQARAPGASVPALEELSPRDFADILQWSATIAVESPLSASRMIQFGTGIAGVVGRDWTGQTLSTIDVGPATSTLFAPYAKAIASGAPLLIHEARRAKGQSWREDWRLILPCTTRKAGGAISRLVVFVLFETMQDQLRWRQTVDEWKIIGAKTYRSTADADVAAALPTEAVAAGGLQAQR